MVYFQDGLLLLLLILSTTITSLSHATPTPTSSPALSLVDLGYACLYIQGTCQNPGAYSPVICFAISSEVTTAENACLDLPNGNQSVSVIGACRPSSPLG